MVRVKRKYVRRRGDKWVVLDHNMHQIPGAVHDTKEAAARQLRAIEASKHRRGKTLYRVKSSSGHFGGRLEKGDAEQLAKHANDLRKNGHNDWRVVKAPYRGTYEDLLAEAQHGGLDPRAPLGVIADWYDDKGRPDEAEFLRRFHGQKPVETEWEEGQEDFDPNAQLRFLLQQALDIVPATGRLGVTGLLRQVQRNMDEEDRQQQVFAREAERNPSVFADQMMVEEPAPIEIGNSDPESELMNEDWIRELARGFVNWAGELGRDRNEWSEIVSYLDQVHPEYGDANIADQFADLVFDTVQAMPLEADLSRQSIDDFVRQWREAARENDMNAMDPSHLREWVRSALPDYENYRELITAMRRAMNL